MSLRGAGAIRFWGFSPALDLTSHIGARVSAEAEAPVRFLLICPSDVRHLLRSLASASAAAATTGGAPTTLEFCVYESAPESLARQLLLLSIALDVVLPRRERAEVFLEVLANTSVRERTAAYVASRAQALRRLLADEEGALAPLIDVSLLKMKERDAIEDVLATWLEEVPFDVVRLRDERLRNFYQDRYDSRRNVLDWDYTMELAPVASIVHKLHFREWRMTGLAFEVRDSAYVAPNRSLASMAAGRERGRSMLRRGYWGDVANSPYASVGVECNEPRLLAKKSGQHVRTACDVAYYNVLRWLTQIETGKDFVLCEEDVADFEYGGAVGGATASWLPKGFLRGTASGAAGPTIEEEGPDAADDAADDAAPQLDEATRARLEGAKMARLPPFRLRLLGGEWHETKRKARHAAMYDAVTVGSHVAHLLADKEFNRVLRPRAAVLVETAKYVVETRKENRIEFGARMAELAEARGWTRAGADGDGASAAVMHFEYDATTADAIAEAARARRAAAAPPAAADGATDGVAQGVKELELKTEEPTAELDEDGAVIEVRAPPAADAPADAPAAAPADAPPDAGAGGGRVCAITGEPAKYRDPVSGLPYANLEAFRELRRRYPAPERLAPADAEGADGEASQPPRQPPIVVSSGGVVRRVNKVV